ncbi:MAG: cofactor-independent phosphoglycerate mutase [Methanocellales archaeon]|nr:cofactor-independent phosphoglycerate mutase [Methanocellales archaeon]MDD3292178.1 cofactor-independent phosphoglycerate mutase [Methanocellales archaeon]MDD5235755.1 cofactor-independent phosphoglycerate mutase [Methanocellales archaeon]MDD5485820.1 cofactor-independent phosphoglycerate mutase [Methanocellales archaeon]
MKYVVLVGDGMEDYPIKALEGRTPLQVAYTPNMDFISAEGMVGTVRTIPEGMYPGSDVANLSILGYDPRKYYTGRGPLEAASMGVFLDEDDVAFRCNLVTVKDGILVDYSAGHISTEEGRSLIKLIDGELGDRNISFHPGISYRHLLVLKGCEKVKCVPPHDMVGHLIEENLPSGKGSKLLKKLMQDSRSFLGEYMIWPWGPGKAPNLPSFEEKYGLSGSVISAVDLIKGIGRCAELQIIDVPGATGYLDTNYRGKAEYALRSLEKKDFAFVHVEAPDEAGHEGNIGAKIKAIEDFDEKVVGTMLDGLEGYGEHKILVLSDHPTPISLRTHTADPVGFSIFSTGEFPNMGFIEEGHRLMDIFIKGY